jgi:hypothetical protein
MGLTANMDAAEKRKIYAFVKNQNIIHGVRHVA